MQLDDDERERLYQRLSQAAADGDLELDELERRVALVAEAQTVEQAASATEGLPPLPEDHQPAGRPRWGHGHGDADAPKPGWRPTPERFRDPRTNKVMRVWEDAAGGRHYVADDG